MTDDSDIREKERRKLNIIIAVALGIIALTVAILPFFYLSKAVVTG